MKQLCLIFCLCLGIQLHAQEGLKPWKYTAGIGTGFRFPNPFGPELNSLLSSQSSFPQIATNLSVGVDYQKNDVLSFGIQTWAMLFPRVETSASQVTLSGVGIGLQGAYKIIDKGDFSSSFYLGGGYYRTASVITNEGFLVNRDPLFIPPGNSQLIVGQIAYLDLGVQFWRQTTGIMDLGLSGGYLTRVTGTDWRASWGDSISVLTPPALSLLYLKLSVAIKQKE